MTKETRGRTEDDVVGDLILAAMEMAEVGSADSMERAPAEYRQAYQTTGPAAVRVLVVELRPEAPVVALRLIGDGCEFEIFRFETKRMGSA